MPNKELLDYIKAELAEGISESDIVSALLAAGWGKQDVDDALKAVHGPQPDPSTQAASATPTLQPAATASAIAQDTLSQKPESQPATAQVTPPAESIHTQPLASASNSPLISPVTITTPSGPPTAEPATVSPASMPNTTPVTTPAVTSIPLTTAVAKPKNKLPQMLGLVFVLGLIGGVTYLAYQSFTGKPLTDAVARLGKTVPTLAPTSIPSLPVQPSSTMPSVASPSAELTFATNLETCTPYKTPFKHILTGEMLTKEIVGIKDDKCVYIEQMPNNGKMECHYSQSERTVMAQFYKDTAGATYSASASADLTTGKVKSTYTINGKTAVNPLQEALDAKVCVVSGYAGLP